LYVIAHTIPLSIIVITVMVRHPWVSKRNYITGFLNSPESNQQYTGDRQQTAVSQANFVLWINQFAE